VARAATGEFDAKDQNPVTTMEAQAFKRACEKHGMGRDFYFLPVYRVGYDPTYKKLLETPTLPDWYRAKVFTPFSGLDFLEGSTPAPEAALAAGSSRTVPSSQQKKDEGKKLPVTILKMPAGAVKCSICGQPIAAAANSKGETVSAATIIATTTKRFGKPACMDDFKRLNGQWAEVPTENMTADQVFAIARLIVQKEMTTEQVKEAVAAGSILPDALKLSQETQGVPDASA